MTLRDRFRRREPMHRPSTLTVEAGPYTITVSGEALEALLDVARREGVTLEDVLARAIAVQKAVVDAKAQGRKVYIEPKGKAPRELVSA
jgi:hypothetical protein